MSICIEQNYQNNFSQSLSACESKNTFSFAKALAIMELWVARSRQRKQLAQLDDWMLEDIGLSCSQVENEISKPFWR